MGQSKQFKHILELGKRLVKELGMTQSTDTLDRWMAHHIAELIEQTEKAEEKDRSRFEDRCREAILELWRHVDVLPKDTRPLEDLQSILATIRALGPEKRAYFYQQQAQESVNNSKLPEEAKEWLELSLGLDYSARLLISMCLKNAADLATEQCSDWIKFSESILDEELPLINVVRLLSKNKESDQKREAVESEIKILEDRRERLCGMIKASELLTSEIDARIKKLDGE